MGWFWQKISIFFQIYLLMQTCKFSIREVTPNVWGGLFNHMTVLSFPNKIFPLAFEMGKKSIVKFDRYLYNSVDADERQGKNVS